MLVSSGLKLKYVGIAMRLRLMNLLPEEDALDDLEEDDEADPTVPGDLWFRGLVARIAMKERWKGRRILAAGHTSGL